MELRLLWWSVLATLLFCTLASALGLDDIASHRICSNCGMDRKSYGYSRTLIRYADGSEVGCCSLNCALVELEGHPGRQLQALLVADRDTLALIDSKSAYWVMGGKKRGVMTGRPKWAFAGRRAAATFLASHGGAPVNWETVLAAAQEDASLSRR
jgi:nitrous oxide reductase accessory protein NosL